MLYFTAVFNKKNYGIYLPNIYYRENHVQTTSVGLAQARPNNLNYTNNNDNQLLLSTT